MGRIEGLSCESSAECQAKDVNLVCLVLVRPAENSTTVVSTTTAATTDTSGICKCRRDMRWNSKALECQLFIDVDCKNVTYSSTVSDEVKVAAETLETTLANVTITIPTNRTQTAEEGLKESLLSVITASDNATLDILNEKNQNLMLFIRGNAMSAAPSISGTSQFPNPPIKIGITIKKIIIKACAVTTTL